MREILMRPVFRVRDESYSWGDVVMAAALWGDWDRTRDEARAGLACLHSYRVAGRSLPDAEIEDAAVEFRYAHELVAAEEAEAWLTSWGLTATQWMEYIRRAVMRQKLASRIPELVARHPISDDELASASGAEAICSGLLSRLAPKLAARAAMHDRIRAARQNGGPLFPERAVAEIVESIPWPAVGLDEERLLASSRKVAVAELALREFRAEALTPRALADQISSHHLEWIRVAYQTLAYPAEAMAREALLCVREDGMGFEELARDSGVAELREELHWIGELKGALHAALLGARAGDVVGPFAKGNTHTLHRLTMKRLPTAEDEEVRGRAERSILTRALAAELQERVKWLITL
jgi:hypothetical protein